MHLKYLEINGTIDGFPCKSAYIYSVIQHKIEFLLWKQCSWHWVESGEQTKCLSGVSLSAMPWRVEGGPCGRATGQHPSFHANKEPSYTTQETAWGPGSHMESMRQCQQTNASTLTLHTGAGLHCAALLAFSRITVFQTPCCPVLSLYGTSCLRTTLVIPRFWNTCRVAAASCRPTCQASWQLSTPGVLILKLLPQRAQK